MSLAQVSVRRQVLNAFRQVKRLAPGEQDEFLAGLPPEVRSQVEQRLRLDAGLASPSTSPTREFHDSDYEFLQTLGQGGFGTVYRARQKSLDREVAVKLIAGHLASPEAMVRFQQEPMIVARLNHPHIVKVYEVGEHHGRPFFSMELVEGGSLAEHLGDYLGEPTKSARLMVLVARAVAEAHQCKVLHRDLKPGNILLDKMGTPHVTDFGIAKLLASGDAPPLVGAESSPGDAAPEDDPRAEGGESAGLQQDLATVPPSTDGPRDDTDADSSVTRTGQLLGTCLYMAPEQASGLVVDERTDVYGLGTILYQMLTGHPPVVSGSQREVLRRVRENAIRLPTEVQPDIPRDLEAVCLKALAKHPRDRYHSAADLADDLQNFLEGRPVAARPVGRWEQMQMWRRRSPWTFATIATLAIGILLVSAATFVAVGQARIARGNARTAQLETTRARMAEAEQRRQRSLAVEAAGREAKANRESQTRLMNMRVKQGRQRLDAGDPLGAMPWFVAAQQMDPDNPAHGLRLGAILRQTPAMTRIWFLRGAIHSLQFDDAGDVLLAAGENPSAWLLGLRNQRDDRPLEHPRAVLRAAFSPDRTRIVTVARDGRARIWDADTCQQIGAAIEQSQPIMDAEFSPDGRRLATASGQRYRVQTVKYREIPGPLRKIPGAMQMQRIPDGRGGFLTIPKPGPPIYIPGPPTRIPIIDTPKGFGALWNVATPQQEPLHQMRASGWLLQATFSPDGSRVATAGARTTSRGQALLWDADTGEQIGEPLLHRYEVIKATFNADGSRLLTASNSVSGHNGEALLWDVASGRRVGRPMEHGGELIEAAISPDGRRILTASADGTARVWDAANGQALLPPWRHQGPIAAATFSPDGGAVLTASNDLTARVWNARSGAPLTPFLRHSSRVQCVAFSPDGRRLATGCADGTVRIWDLSGPRSRTFALRADGRAEAANRALMSRDGGQLIATSGPRVPVLATGGTMSARNEIAEDSQIVVLEAAGGELLWTQPLSDSRPDRTSSQQKMPYSISPAGDRIALLDAENRVTLADVATGDRQTTELKGVADIVHLQTLSSQRCLVVAIKTLEDSERELQVWNAVSGSATSPPMPVNGVVHEVLVSPAGDLLLTVSTPPDTDNSELCVWDLRRGEISGKGQLPGGSSTSSPVRLAHFAADGRHLVIVPGGGFFDDRDRPHGEAQIWDMAGKRVATLRHRGQINHVSTDPSGRRVLTASSDHTVRLWHLDGTPALPPMDHGGVVLHASFDDSGTVVATASADGKARTWSAATGEPITPPLPHGDRVTCAHFAPGRPDRLVTADCSGHLRIWELGWSSRQPADLEPLAELLAGQYIDETGGVTLLSPEQLESRWRVAQDKFADVLATPIDAAAPWHRMQAQDAEVAEAWFAADHHLSHLLRLAPDASAAERGAWLSRRAESRAARQRWDEAREDFEQAAALGVPGLQWRRGLVALRARRLQEYRQHCADAVARLDGASGDSDLSLTEVARLVVAAPNPIGDYRTLSERLATPSSSPESRSLAVAIEFRRGEADAADLAALEGLGSLAGTRHHLFLTMALARDDPTAAAAALADARQRIQDLITPDPPAAKTRLSWIDQLEMDLLYQQAAAAVAEAERGGAEVP